MSLILPQCRFIPINSVLAVLLLLVALSPIAFCGTRQSLPEKQVIREDDTRVALSNSHAFSQPVASLSMSERLDFSVGNSFFRNPWVMAPSSTTARDGLGPLFNTNGCQNCHIKDGRGHLPEASDENAVSLLLRLSVPALEGQEQLLREQGVVAEPNYGDQLQDFAIPGVAAEGQIKVDYREIPFQFHDGETVSLREPVISIEQPGYGELHKNVMISARIAPPMIGLGLLAAVPDQALLVMEDSEDSDRDGISGRVNRVWDKQKSATVVGRFGWKSGQPTLRQQNAAAFLGDLGITSSLFPEQNCTASQIACRQSVAGGTPELSENILDKVTFYTHHLAVPARRGETDVQVMAGEQLFLDAGCVACHKPSLQTADSPFPSLAFRLIAPYTDLLLHDMGEGLADHRPEFAASGSEWRTPPLWGIGLTREVSGRESYLHDGRARTLMEAILWHGGEAANARGRVEKMSRQQRDALLMFLRSL
ncbi:MAG: c-type cytochrome [Pseudomonadales bacterium]|nr:c-type cytochrome [Pseudomonadales bacterium]